MLGTTLLPTLIHFGVVSLSGVLSFNWLRRYALDHFNNHSWGFMASWSYMTLIVPVSFVLLPLLVGYLLVTMIAAHGGFVGIHLLNTVQTTAGLFDSTIAAMPACK